MFTRSVADFRQETKMFITRVYLDDLDLIVSGPLDKTNIPYTGVAHFPRDRKYPFWYYPDELTIYWDNDKGATTNNWNGGLCYPGFF